MREGRPSITAAIVAAARGAAGIDPIAARLLPPGFAAIARGSRLTRFLPLVDLMRVRTLTIDEAVTRTANPQLVVLGAGLCARAWRMDALAGVTVYEVDHPSTQAYKRRRLAALSPRAKEVRFVAVDFERDDLVLRLGEAGHDAGAPTTWIWEGVTPYLTPPAIVGTLEAVRGRSAASSVLVMTYGTPLEERTGAQRILYQLAPPLLRALGEPLHGLVSVAAMTEMVESAGFRVHEDRTYVELAARMSLRVPRPIVAERLLVASR